MPKNLNKGMLNTIICDHFCTCGHISRFKDVDDVQCDCFNYLFHGHVAQWLSEHRQDSDKIFAVIKERVEVLVALRDLFLFDMHLYFDNDNKNDDTLESKERYGEYKAQEDILKYAKSLLKSHGFTFRTVLGTADEQMRYDTMRWKRSGRLVVSISFDTDFAILGQKTIRLNCEKTNGKNGIVGYVDLECIKITPKIKADKTLSNLIKISRNRVKGAILYSLIDTFKGKDISIQTVISIAAAQGQIAKFDRRLKRIQNYQEKSFEQLKETIFDNAAEDYLCPVVYNPELGKQRWDRGLRFCHPVLAQSYRKFKNISTQKELMEKAGLKKWTKHYLKKVRDQQFDAIEYITPDMKSLNKVKETIRKGKAAEGPVSTYKYDQIPSLDFTAHDKYLERIDLYQVSKDFSQEDQSTNSSILTQRSM